MSSIEMGMERETLASSSMAMALATSTEADELRPAAKGTLPVRWRSKAGGSNAALLQLTEDADGVVGPEAAGGRAVVAIDGEGFGEEFAGEAVEIVSSWGDGDVRGEGNGHGENEAAGVVGVFTEKIDASGGDALNGLAGWELRGMGRAVAD